MLQSSVIGPLFFIICFDNLSQGLKSKSNILLLIFPYFAKRFISECLTLDVDLLKIQDYAYQQKMSFIPDQTKQSQKFIFSRARNIAQQWNTVLAINRAIWKAILMKSYIGVSTGMSLSKLDRLQSCTCFIRLFNCSANLSL